MNGTERPFVPFFAFLIAAFSFLRETLPADMMRGKPLCMNQYKCMFGVTRTPDLPGDKLHFSWPTKSKTIIVLVEDQIYSIQVIHDASGELFSLQEIEA